MGRVGTDFHNGLSVFGVPQLPGVGLTPVGSVFWVGSTTAGSTDSPEAGTKEVPFRTLKYALTQVAADDMILITPTHAETVTGVGGLTFGTAGVTVVGLGSANRRPTFTVTGTTTTWLVSAANVTIRNVIISSGVAELVTVFNVTAAGCTLDAVDYREAGGFTTIKFLTTSTAADQLTIKNCHHIAITAAGSNSGWLAPNGCDDLVVQNNKFYIVMTNSASSGIILGVTTLSARVFIVGNNMVALGGASILPIVLYTGTTGMVAYNDIASLSTTLATSVNFASAYGFQNYNAHVVNKSAIIAPGADS